MENYKLKPPEGRPDTLKCQVCDHTEKAPMHCRAPMHIEDGKLVCWMGTSCGEAPLPDHHEKPMVLIS